MLIGIALIVMAALSFAVCNAFLKDKSVDTKRGSTGNIFGKYYIKFFEKLGFTYPKYVLDSWQGKAYFAAFLTIGIAFAILGIYALLLIP